ncbi:MAG: hypothetical protein ACXWCZ_02620 [Flavisolibacter sp.]
MKATIYCIALTMLFSSCSKMAETVLDKGLSINTNPSKFIQYTIQKGNQFSDQSIYAPIETAELKFAVKFDSSAIYKTISAENQYDINKLFGFSDNNAEHHQYSARIGWGWSDNSLRLYAYVYNQGIRESKEIGTIAVGSTANCSIKVQGKQYVFKVNELKVEMPRLSETERASGYQLYPYFGGDETAPHLINIWIRMIDEAK